MTSPLPLIPTTVVGSYPQPDWLVDRDMLRSQLVPRVRATGMWRVPEPLLEQAQDDATLLAIRDMERAGIDIITDGEIRRESYSNRFATSLEGIDLARPGEVMGRVGRSTKVPRVVGPIRRRGPVEVRDVQFLRRNTERATKITLPGPFTMSLQTIDEHYKDKEALAMAFAAAVNEEIRDLQAAGADYVQIDDPWLQSHAEDAKRFGVKALNRALEGIEGRTIVHLCFGYAHYGQARPGGYSFLPQLAETTAEQVSIEAAQAKLDLGVLKALAGKRVVVGVISLGDPAVETPEVVASRIRDALRHVPTDKLSVSPDCGMKYLPRETAFGKLKALHDGAQIVRREITGSAA
jgi:5-methyltetrahydropteroyltriglutamate--homocysteine methyltransferase